MSEPQTYPLTPDLDWVPQGFRLVEEPGRNPARGNLLLLDPQVPRVLKVYRRRRALHQELGTALAHRWFEGKRGTSPAERRDTERTSLALWAAEGVPVVGLREEPAPPWVGPYPSLWLDYTPGPRLFDVLQMDPAVPAARKLALVEQLAPLDQARHEAALEKRQPLLFHEHPTTKHVLVHQERLLWFDLEGGYRRGYPILIGLAQDLAGILRSLWSPHVAACFEDPLPRRYVEVYDRPGLLRDAARHYLRGGVGGWIRRASDQGRRSARSKTAALEQLLEHLA